MPNSEEEECAKLRAKSDEFRAMGFESGESVASYNIDWKLDELKASLFDSTYSNPLPLKIVRDEHEGNLLVVPTSVTAVYRPRIARLTDKPIGYWERPFWQIDGWIVRTGYDPAAEIVRVRLFVDNEFEWCHIQRIPAHPEPDGLIVAA